MPFYFKRISDILEIIDVLDRLRIKYRISKWHELVALDPEDRAIVVELCERFGIEYTEGVR